MIKLDFERYVKLPDLARRLSGVFNQVISMFSDVDSKIVDTNNTIGEIKDELDSELVVVKADIANISIEINNLKKRYIVDVYSSGSNWYEVYSDGWLRQGKLHISGGSSGAHNETVTFQIAMENTSYSVYTSYDAPIATVNFYGYEVPSSRAVGQMQFRSFNGHRINFVVEGWGNSTAVTALGATPDY